MWQKRADIRNERIERQPERILEENLHRVETLGARGDNVLLLKLIEQIGAKPADHGGGPRRADDDDRDPEMSEDRKRLRPGPRLIEVYRVHQTAHRNSQIDMRQINQHEREQETRGGKPEKPQKRQEIIGHAVLVRRGVDTGRKG